MAKKKRNLADYVDEAQRRAAPKPPSGAARLGRAWLWLALATLVVAAAGVAVLRWRNLI